MQTNKGMLLSKASSAMDSPIFASARVGLWIVFAFVVIQAALSTLQGWVWLQRDPYRHMYGVIESGTAFLVQPTLVFNALVGLVLVLGLFIGVGRLTWHDIGFRRSQLRQGFAVLLVLWFGVQILLLPNAWLMDGGLAWFHPTQGNGVPFLFGALISQLFGNALVEELCFRGFLMVQLVLWFHAWQPERPRLALWAGVLISQFIFSAMHLPIRVHNGLSGTQLIGASLETYAFGLFFAWQYLRTRNLLVVIATHAIFDTPMPLVQSSYDPKAVVLALALAMTILWPWLQAAYVKRRTKNRESSPSTA